MSTAWPPIVASADVGRGHVCLVGAGEYLERMAGVDRVLLGLTPAAREGRPPGGDLPADSRRYGG